MRSLLSVLRVLGGDQIRWVGLGYGVPTISGWRPDVLLRDVLNVFMKGLLRCPPPRPRPALQARLVCVAGGERLGHWRAAPGWCLWTVGGREPKRGAGGHALEPRGPSRVAGTLAQPGSRGAGERRAGPRGAVRPERQWLRSGGT